MFCTRVGSIKCQWSQLSEPAVYCHNKPNTQICIIFKNVSPVSQERNVSLIPGDYYYFNIITSDWDAEFVTLLLDYFG